MSENKKLSYGARQMMLCSGSWGNGHKDIDFPYVALKGYWFRFWGFNSGDQITLVNLAPGIVVLQVTKLRAQFQREGWPNRYYRHNGLSHGQLIKFADDLLRSTQVFCDQVLELTKPATAA